MLFRRLLIASSCCVCISAASAAQQSIDPILFGCDPPDLEFFKREWSSALSTGAFTRTLAGDFDGLGGPDVLIRRGFGAALLPNVAYEEGNADLPINVADMARLPDLGQFAGDAIAVVNANGLHQVSYDPATHTFSVALLAASWAGAKLVVAADVDGNGLCDLVGISSDGQSMLHLRQDSPGNFAPSPSVSLDGTVIKTLQVIEWDGDSESELALVTQTGWGVCALDGTALAVKAKSFVAGDNIAVIHDPSPTDRLAHTSRTNGGASAIELRVLRPGGTLDGPVAVGPYRAAALATADLRGSGFDDLLLNVQSDFKVLRIKNQRTQAAPSGPDFSPYAVEVDTVEAGGPQPSICTPLAIDLDLDKSIDYLAAFETTARVYTLVKLSSVPLLSGTCILYAMGPHPFFRNTDFVDAKLVQWLETGGCTEDYGSRVFLSVRAIPWGAGLPVAGQRIEVVMWRQTNMAVTGDLEQPSMLHAIYTVGVDPQVRLGTFVGEADVQIEVPVDETTALLSTCYFFQVRLLPAVGQSGSYATYIGSFTGMSDPIPPPNSTAAYLAGLPGAIYGLMEMTVWIATLCSNPTNQNLGAMAPQTRIPKLPSGLPPQVSAVGTGTGGLLGHTAPPPPYAQ